MVIVVRRNFFGKKTILICAELCNLDFQVAHEEFRIEDVERGTELSVSGLFCICVSF